MRVIYLNEAARMLMRRIRIFFSGIKQYSGDSEKICKSLIRDCYDEKKKYFRVSTGNFSEFYARDFGWCAESLVKLGFRDNVIRTLDYALGTYERHGIIEQTINPSGKPFTFPNVYSPDALVFIIHALRIADDKRLVGKYKVFLEKEVARYFDIAIEKETGLIKRGVHFSSMKDYSVRSSSCYDNSLAGMLKNDLEYLGLINPLRKYDYEKILIKYFWSGTHFKDDLSGNDFICGDANVMPFWTGVVKKSDFMKKSIAAIRKEQLDMPFPLKYTSSRHKDQAMIKYEGVAGDYERDTVWAHVGLMYIDVVSRVDKKLAKQYLLKYKKVIEEHKNFLELFDRNGKPFKTLFYYTDDSIIWAANYLDLYNQLS